MNVNIHIDRLVLDGIDVPHSHHSELREVVERELHRLIAESSVPQRFKTAGAIDRIAAGKIQPRTHESNVLGQGIAAAVYGGLK